MVLQELSLQGKTALVTGGGSGIGSGITRGLAEAGADIACVYSRHPPTEIEAYVRGLGREFLAIQADVSRMSELPRVMDETVTRFGHLDILVNNAGIAEQKLFTDVTAAEWDEMMAVHVRGAFLCCKAALPHMIRQKWGRIINISSMWGQVGASCEVPYSAAKAALIGMTKALAKEEGPSGVTVNCIAPGAVDTEMMAGFSAQDKAALCEETPLCRLGTPQDIAAAVAFLASEQAGFVTGQVLGVNGGFVV